MTVCSETVILFLSVRWISSTGCKRYKYDRWLVFHIFSIYIYFYSMFACSHISIFPSLWLKVHFVSSVSLSSLAGCIPPSCLWFYHLFFGLSLKIQFFFHMKRNIWCLSWGAESRLWLVVCMQMFHVLSWQIVSWAWPWFDCFVLFWSIWPLSVLLWPSMGNMRTFQKHASCSAQSAM